MNLHRMLAPALRPVRRRAALGVALLATCTAAFAGAPPAAETVYRDGVVYTVDAADTVAQAIAISGGRIVYVGSDVGAKPLIDKRTRVIDLQGAMVMPGLIDGHMHPVIAGIDLLKCNLNYELLTVTEFQRRIQACLDKSHRGAPDSWLEVVNWFRYGMSPKGIEVTRATLDELRTDRPIVVHDSFGHSSLANSKALMLAKVGSTSKDPVGGRIDRDTLGAPTGILEDAAQGTIALLIPKPTPQDYAAGARAALDALRRQGVTTFLDAVGTDADIDAMATLERAGALTARAHFAPLVPPAEVSDEESAQRAVARIVAVARKYDEGAIRPSPSISVHNVKLFMDGVINAPANTGALLEPYFENHGTETSPRFEPAARREPDVYFPAAVLTPLLIGFGESGIDPHLHTDGDGAVRAALDAVQAMRAALPGRDIRPGFAHCELVDPSDYPRFAELNVTPVLSFQWEKPAGDTVEGARDSLGPKRYPLIEPAGYLAAKGARIAYGSDWPVDPLDEWLALQVGVTRSAGPGAQAQYAGRLGNDPGLTQAAAIRAITLNAAYELHEDQRIGSIEAGKLADLIVLDRNVAKIPPDQIAATKVLRTVVGGRVVYDDGQLTKRQ